MNKAAAPPPVAPALLSASEVAPALLAWYDRHRRVLPWRSPAGTASDPYAVWLSEIMLQQTTVAAVKPYFAAFLSAWPTVDDLAAAPLDEVLSRWAGLGYYSRARNLHACARAVMASHGGGFPSDEVQLRKLPGIGPYTAAAVAAIAFGRRAVVVDGNVERVMARLFAIEAPLPGAKPLLHAAMNGVTPGVRVGDFAQAVMDLGATICTPRSPACVICPLTPLSEGRRRGIAGNLPVKARKAAVPRRGGAIFMISQPNGALLVRRRPPKGLFGGMMEFPSTHWTADFDPAAPVIMPPGLRIDAERLQHIGRVEHGLAHFTLTLDVYRAELSGAPDPSDRWATPDGLAGEALPTLMRKVLDLYVAQSLNAASTTPADVAPLISRPLPPSPAPEPSRRRRMRRTTGRRTVP